MWRFKEVAGSEGLGFREVWRTDVALSFMSVGRWSLVLGSAYVPRRESKEEERGAAGVGAGRTPTGGERRVVEGTEKCGQRSKSGQHDSLETRKTTQARWGQLGQMLLGKLASEGETEELLKGDVRYLKTANSGTCLVAKRKSKFGRQDREVIDRVRSPRREEVMEPVLGTGVASGQGGRREASMGAGWRVNVKK